MGASVTNHKYEFAVGIKPNTFDIVIITAPSKKAAYKAVQLQYATEPRAHVFKFISKLS